MSHLSQHAIRPETPPAHRRATQRRSRIGLTIAALLFGGAAAGCTSSDSGVARGDSTRADSTIAATTDTASSPSVEPPATEAPTTTAAPEVSFFDSPYGQEVANVDANGDRTVESALALFAMAIAPLPGVDATPSGTVGARSGSLAIHEIDVHYDELTPEQQAAVEAALAPPPDAETTVIPAGFAPRPGATPGETAKQVIEEMRATIAGKLGVQLPGPVTVIVQKLTDGDYGRARPDFSSGQYGGCTIWIDGITYPDSINTVNTAVHELFHCFQAAAVNSKVAFKARAWLFEGSASWAAADLSFPDGSESGFWDEYLTEPDRALFTRSYDAIGFFSHMRESGTDPWSVLAAMFRAGDNAGAWSASGADSAGFMTTWGSSVLREPQRGGAWDTNGPGISGASADADPLTVTNGTNVGVDAPLYASHQYDVALQADIVTFFSTGFTRMSDGTLDVANVSGSYCAKVGGCGECPDGTPLPQQPPLIGPQAAVAVASNGTGSSGLIVGVSLDEWCKEHKTVQARLERPGSDGALPGTVIEVYGCDGPFGTWNGVLRAGGLSSGGFEVPFAELPLSFAFSGQDGAQTATAVVDGALSSPIGTITVHWDLTVSVDAAGTTLSFDGTGSVDGALVPVSTGIGPGAASIPIQPSESGQC